MSWRIEQANPSALLRDLPDGLFQTGILRVPADLPDPDVASVLRKLHRVTRGDGTLWLLGAAHQSAALETGWHHPTGRRFHPRPPVQDSHRLLTVTLLAKRPQFYFNARLPLLAASRCSCERSGSDRRAAHRRRAWCVPPVSRLESPQQLIAWCVQASTSPKACEFCGAPWRRGIQRVWLPSCEHRNGRGRCLVIDPFCGTGLSGVVSLLAGRGFLGIEHDPQLARCAQRRLATANWTTLR